MDEITQITQKISGLQKEKKALEEELKSVKVKLEAQKRIQLTLEQRIKELTDKYTRLATVKSVVLSEGDRIIAQKKIKALIKEVDNCIKTLDARGYDR